MVGFRKVRANVVVEVFLALSFVSAQVSGAKVSISTIRAILVVGFFAVIHFGSANIFNAPTEALNTLQGQIIAFAVVVGGVVFAIGTIGKTSGAEWGQRLMTTSIVGIVLAGATVAIIGLFAPAGAGPA